ncbi:MAG: metalloregulator ArsR/SmtB family transcription factor [Planctomycetota bacterium]
MARTAATTDIFTAIAEPHRRRILQFLAAGEQAVNDIVTFLAIAQPQVSKHLSILKSAGLVSVRPVGRQRLYRTNTEALKTVHAWTSTFEQYWGNQLNAIKASAEAQVDASERASH